MVLRTKIKNLNWHQCRHPLLAIFTCLLIAGCANGKLSALDQQASLDTLVKQADSEMANGKSEQSIALLNQAAKENPTSMVPWLKMSNIWFNGANYPSAILAANEVLLRDAENQEAKSILVVAGLRVAAGAITGLVPQNPVNPSARAEAENLTKALRTALGEKILVPAPVAQVAAPAPVKHHARKHVARTGPAAAEAPVVKAAPATKPAPEVDTRSTTVSINTSGSGSDPFKSLK